MIPQHHPLIGREISIRKAIPLVIRAAPDNTRFSLRIDPLDVAKASAAFGLDLPTTIGDVATAGGKIAVSIGPDEWHLIAPLVAQEAIENAFAELYAQVPHSLVDIGHREVGIDIEGADAVLVLQSAIAFDVGQMPFPSGRRTIFDRAQIVLVREADHRFRIEVWRSFADHVWGLLQAASREIQLDI
ncbi:sarcosine oxidase subunit gamma [Pseudochelatococcus sp. B33]